MCYQFIIIIHLFSVWLKFLLFILEKKLDGTESQIIMCHLYVRLVKLWHIYAFILRLISHNKKRKIIWNTSQIFIGWSHWNCYKFFFCIGYWLISIYLKQVPNFKYPWTYYHLEIRIHALSTTNIWERCNHNPLIHYFYCPMFLASFFFLLLRLFLFSYYLLQ